MLTDAGDEALRVGDDLGCELVAESERIGRDAFLPQREPAWKGR